MPEQATVGDGLDQIQLFLDRGLVAECRRRAGFQRDLSPRLMPCYSPGLVETDLRLGRRTRRKNLVPTQPRNLTGGLSDGSAATHDNHPGIFPVVGLTSSWNSQLLAVNEGDTRCLHNSQSDQHIRFQLCN